MTLGFDNVIDGDHAYDDEGRSFSAAGSVLVMMMEMMKVIMLVTEREITIMKKILNRIHCDKRTKVMNENEFLHNTRNAFDLAKYF